MNRVSSSSISPMVRYALTACDGSLSAGVAGKLYVKSLRAGDIAQDGNRALVGAAIYETVSYEEGAVFIVASCRHPRPRL